MGRIIGEPGHGTQSKRDRASGVVPRPPRWSRTPWETDRETRTRPRNRSLNRSRRADAFAAFEIEVLHDLNPRGSLEHIMVEQVASAAWKLKEAVDRQVTRLRTEVELSDEPKKVSATAIERASRSVKEALESLRMVRESKTRDKGRLESSPVPDELDLESNEWPVLPLDTDDFSPIDEPESFDSTPIWRDRLVFDFEVSDHSPVIRGTWITVSHLVSLIVDGQTWADILRSHPELSEDDIRASVAYAVAQDQDEG